HIPISHTPPIRPPPRPTLFPYTTLFRSNWQTADWHRATVCDEQTPMTTDTLATILGGGQGSRLFPLTITRSKPAVPIGGKYRLIDVPISGCLHADIRRIFVLTQFNSASLNRHISQTYQ